MRQCFASEHLSCFACSLYRFTRIEYSTYVIRNARLNDQPQQTLLHKKNKTKQNRWRILAKYFQSSIIFFPTCTTLHAQSLGEMQGGHQQYAALMQHCSCCRCCCFKKLVSLVLVSWISAAQRLIGIRRLSEGHRLDSWWVRTQNIFFRATFLTKSEAVVIFPRLAPVTCFHRVLIGSLRICVWRDWPDLISF